MNINSFILDIIYLFIYKYNSQLIKYFEKRKIKIKKNTLKD